MGIQQGTFPSQFSAPPSLAGVPNSWSIIAILQKPFNSPNLTSYSTTTLVAAQGTTNCDTDYPNVEALAAEVFADSPVMLRVGCAESHFAPEAKNASSTATGVYQILIGTWKQYGCLGSRKNASDNIACARKIFDNEGTSPWDASKDIWDSYPHNSVSPS